MEKKTILESVDPDIVSRMISRREAIGKVGKLGIVAATAPVALGVMANETFGQGGALPQQIVEVLNFALTLEHLEDEFYKAARRSRSLIPRQYRRTFDTISDHETAHVRLLRTVLGAQAIQQPQFDVTGGGAFADVMTNFQTFIAVSQALEDTGVRAYKGQAGNLMSNDTVLQTALQIHSVEARHAAQVRRIRGQKGWITADLRGGLPAATQPIYDGEGNTTQGGADLSGLPGVARTAITEAFDEPLTREEVLAIARPFIRG